MVYDWRERGVNCTGDVSRSSDEADLHSNRVTLVWRRPHATTPSEERRPALRAVGREGDATEGGPLRRFGAGGGRQQRSGGGREEEGRRHLCRRLARLRARQDGGVRGGATHRNGHKPAALP